MIFTRQLCGSSTTNQQTAIIHGGLGSYFIIFVFMCAKSLFKMTSLLVCCLIFSFCMNHDHSSQGEAGPATPNTGGHPADTGVARAAPSVKAASRTIYEIRCNGVEQLFHSYPVFHTNSGESWFGLGEYAYNVVPDSSIHKLVIYFLEGVASMKDTSDLQEPEWRKKVIARFTDYPVLRKDTLEVDPFHYGIYRKPRE